MNQPFEPFPDKPRLQRAVADAFCDLAIQAVDRQGVFRVSLSGGSTPRDVYRMLAERDLPWDKIHWFWGDERNVPPDHDDSNYRMVRQMLLDHAAIPESNVHAVPVDPNDPASAAAEYDQILRDHFASHWPDWDLVLLGMGDDAHTASLFPATAALAETERWFVENWVEKLDAFRYTLTYPAIPSARNIWMLISGSAKRPALTAVLEAPADLQRFPAQGVSATRWFVTADVCGD